MRVSTQALGPSALKQGMRLYGVGNLEKSLKCYGGVLSEFPSIHRIDKIQQIRSQFY
jgi:hypothetical protein